MAQDLQRPFRLPADAVEVLLVRHGAAVEDGPIGFVDGQGDQPLTATGREQAERVARRLAREAPAPLFVSSLRRAADTAAPLAARLGLRPVVLHELREVHLGSWEAGHEFSQRVAQRDPIVRDFLKSERWDVIPGAESNEAVAERVAHAIAQIVAAVAPGSSTVAFTHAGVIAEVCRQATGSRPLAFLRAENAAVTRIIVDRRGRLSLRSFNDTSHLT